MAQFPCHWLALGPPAGTCHCQSHEYDESWIFGLAELWPSLEQCLMCCSLDGVTAGAVFGPDDNRIGAWLL